MATSSGRAPPPLISSPRPRRILVVGAGPSGLISLRNLLLPDASTPEQQPFEEVLLVERKDEVGGVWYLDPKVVEAETQFKDGTAQGQWPLKLPTGEATKPYWPSPAYPALRGNVLPRFLSFSCHPPFPPPANEEPFPTLAETQRYLLSFAAPLRSNIRCNTEVVGVWELPAPSTKDASVGGGWAVRTRDWSPEGMGRATTTHWDAVVLTNGWTDDPFYAPVPGLEEAVLAGKVHHAKWYRTPKAYATRRVVVVGNGNSANDCVAHIAATRVAGKDEPVYRAVRHQLLPYFVSLPDERIVDVPSIARYLVRPEDDGTSTLDLELEDGSLLTDVDFVIMGTGYRWGTYPFVRLLAHSADDTELGSIPDPVATPSAFAQWDPTETKVDELWHAVTPPARQPDQRDPPPPLPASEKPPPALSPAFPHRVPGLHRQILQARNPTLAFVGLVISHTPFQMADIASWFCRSYWDGSGDLLPATLEAREESDRLRVKELERRKAIVEEEDRTLMKDAREAWYDASRRATAKRQEWLAGIKSSSTSTSSHSSQTGAVAPHIDEGHAVTFDLNAKVSSLALAAPGSADGLSALDLRARPIPPPNPSLALSFHILAFDEHAYAKNLRDDVIRAKPWLDNPVPPTPAPAPLGPHTTSPEPPSRRTPEGEQPSRPLPRRDEEREAVRTAMYGLKKASLIRARAKVRELAAAGNDS